MYIEYDLKLTARFHNRGLINQKFIKWMQVTDVSRGAQALEIYYEGYETVNVFSCDDNHVFQQIYDAFKKALLGEKVEIEGIGYVRKLDHDHIQGFVGKVIPSF